MPIEMGDGLGIANIYRGDGTEFTRVKDGNENLFYGSPSFPLMIDSFEDEDFAEYSGETSGFSFVTNGGAPDGEVHVECNELNDTNVMYSSSGLENYPMQGNEVTFWTSTEGIGIDAHSGFAFGVQDQSNLYAVVGSRYFDATSNHISILKYSGGSINVLAQSGDLGDTPSGDFRYTWESDGTITATYVPTGAQISATDTEWSSGGIGWFGYSAEQYKSNAVNLFYDYARITA